MRSVRSKRRSMRSGLDLGAALPVSVVGPRRSPIGGETLCKCQKAPAPPGNVERAPEYLAGAADCRPRGCPPTGSQPHRPANTPWLPRPVGPEGAPPLPATSSRCSHHIAHTGGFGSTRAGSPSSRRSTFVTGTVVTIGFATVASNGSRTCPAAKQTRVASRLSNARSGRRPRLTVFLTVYRLYPMGSRWNTSFRDLWSRHSDLNRGPAYETAG